MSKQEKMAETPMLYVDALNNRNLDAVMKLYAENAVVEDPVGSDPHIGFAAVREFYKTVVTYDLEAELTGQVRITGNEVAFPFICKNIAAGVAIHIIDVFKFDNEGKVISMKAYWGENNAVKIV